MRNLLWIILAVVIVGGGYLLFSGKSINDLFGEAEDAPAEVETMEEPAAVEAEEATDSATEMAEEAVEAATEEAEEAADSATEMAEEAAETATEEAEEAADSATEMADDAADDAMEEVSSIDPSTLLTVEGFDLEKVTDLIRDSDLGEVKKTLLTKSVEEAADDPELLKAALDAVREALGL